MSGSFQIVPLNIPTCDYTALSAAGSETGTIELYESTGGGGVQPIDATTDTISQVVMQDDTGSDVVTITGISVLYSDFNDALTAAGGDSFKQYAAFVSLMDGTVAIGGNGNANLFLEVGTGGTATVTAGGGNDVLRVWQEKTVDFNGGGGSDLITFQAIDGPYPVTPTQGAVVNLDTGTGTNPYGGTLTLTNVENVIGTELADTLTGNGSANVFGDGIYDTGADQISAKGGDDTVNLAETYGNPGGVNANGGSGKDSLAINFGGFADDGPVHKLDLKDQSKNSGVFTNDVFTNFEVFVHGNGYWVPTGQTFVFVDTNDGHTVEAMAETNTLRLHGGNDTVILSAAPSNYAVDADGGSGKDTLQFEVYFNAADNRLDLVHPGKDSGIFAGGSFTNFEVFKHVEKDGSGSPLQKFTFIGDGNDQTVIGSVGIDVLKGGGGDDTLNGGANNDKLTGGSGKDHFVFDTAIGGTTPVTANVDSVTDFKPGTDQIELENKIFKGIGGNGTLAGKYFHIGSKAADATDHVIYNAKTGVLSYDPDGEGGAPAIEFADLAKHLALTHADFLVI